MELYSKMQKTLLADPEGCMQLLDAAGMRNRLVGSRYHSPSTIDETTDWDFVVLEDKNTSGILRALGFTPDAKASGYKQSPLKLGNIHVLLRNSKEYQVDVQVNAITKDIIRNIGHIMPGKELFGIVKRSFWD